MIKKIIFLIFIFFGMALNIGCESIQYGYEDTYAYTVSKDTYFDDFEFRDYLRRYSKLYKEYNANKTVEVDSQAAVAGPALSGLMGAASPPPGFTNLAGGLLNFLFWSGTKVYPYQFPKFFIWDKSKSEDTPEKINKAISEQFSIAVKAEVEKRKLFLGYNSEMTKELSEDGKIVLAFNNGQKDRETPIYCRIGLEPVYDLPKKENSPKGFGPNESWHTAGPIGGYCFYHTEAMFGYNTKGYPFPFANFEFWLSLSKRLPSNFFIYLAPAGKYYYCKFENGEKLMHPVVLNQGQPHWFYPGAK